MNARTVAIAGLFGFAAVGLWWLWQLPPRERMVAHPERAADCAGESAPELKTLCLVQVAGVSGAAGKLDEVQAACEGVEGFWADECHFRGGEELAHAGAAAEGLKHCAKAGHFARFCLSHVVWGPRALGVRRDELPGLALPFASLPTLPHDTPPEDLLRARWWFDEVYGSGGADAPRFRSVDQADAAYAIGAWALEAVRLTDGDLAAARTAWESSTILEGAALPEGSRLGRYDLPFDIAEEAALPRIPTFGGGKRFVGENPAEDLDIALLEAAYFRESSGAEVFQPFLSDSRPLVRYTALRCFRTLPSPNAESTLRGMAEDPDPIVKAHVSDALKFRTWEGKRNAPGLRTPRSPG